MYENPTKFDDCVLWARYHPYPGQQRNLCRNIKWSLDVSLFPTITFIYYLNLSEYQEYY